MNRQEQIIDYANSFKGYGIENEELKETIRMAVIDGALWALNLELKHRKENKL